MDTLSWVIIVLAIALVWGGISFAWRAFSRPPRVRSPAMKALDESYFAGDITREEYLRRKAELEQKERNRKDSTSPS